MEKLYTNKGLFTRRIDSINIAICFFILFSPIMFMLEFFDGGMIDTIKKLLVGLYFLFFFNAIPPVIKAIKRQNRSFFIVLIIFVLLYYNWIRNLTIHNEIKDFVELVNIHLFKYCIPLLFLGLSIVNINRLLAYLKVTAILILILYGFQYFVFSTLFVSSVYSQEAGYMCATSCIIFWCMFLYKNDRLCLLLVPLSFLFIMLSGARGPILSLFLGIVISFLICRRPKMIHIMAYFLLVCLVFLLFFLMKDFILSNLIGFADQYGLSTRTLEKIMSNDLANDVSRDKLKALAIGYSVDNFPFGTGIFNDRLYLYIKYHSSENATSDIFGAYCHNYFIELWMQFGLILGSVIGIYTIILFVKKLGSHFLKISQLAFVLLLTIGFLPLLVSRSYLTYPYFYLLIGFCFSYRYINSVEKQIGNNDFN